MKPRMIASRNMYGLPATGILDILTRTGRVILNCLQFKKICRHFVTTWLNIILNKHLSMVLLSLLSQPFQPSFYFYAFCLHSMLYLYLDCTVINKHWKQSKFPSSLPVINTCQRTPSFEGRLKKHNKGQCENGASCPTLLTGIVATRSPGSQMSTRFNAEWELI